MKKFLLMFPILFIISCDQSNEIVIPKVGDDYKAQYHFSCNPIGWSRDNIKDRKPVGEYLNYLFYGTYTMDSLIFSMRTILKFLKSNSKLSEITLLMS
jgi:hypothetical protein